jgi:hypothetical protein
LPPFSPPRGSAPFRNNFRRAQLLDHMTWRLIIMPFNSRHWHGQS